MSLKLKEMPPRLREAFLVLIFMVQGILFDF